MNSTGSVRRSVHLITGAGSGIGAAVAHRLRDRGAELVLLARDETRAHDLVTMYDGARVVVADLADPSRLESRLAAANLPARIDSVLHVAGVVDLASVADQTAAGLRHQLDVNLVAPSVITRFALPALRATGGLVLFVNSSAGLTASPTWSAYAASKFGLRALADSLRAEELDNGVRVTTVYPSRTATPMQEKVHQQEGRVYDPARWIHPETVADTILHCLDLPPGATIPDVTIRPMQPRPGA